MKVGVSGIESVRGYGAVPTAAVGFPGGEGGSGGGAVPMMKFMGGNFPSGGAEQILLLGPEGHIAEPGQLAGIKACPRQKAHHGKISDFFRQIHESAALGNAGKATFQSAFYGRAHGCVFAEGLGVQFRIAAAQIKALNMLRKGGILQGTELDDRRAHFPDGFQRILIVKAEGPVPCHGNADRLPPGQLDGVVRQIRRRPA